jgi:hypothetical protein
MANLPRGHTYGRGRCFTRSAANAIGADSVRFIGQSDASLNRYILKSENYIDCGDIELMKFGINAQSCPEQGNKIFGTF